MGAGARQRGDVVIRQRIADEQLETVNVERAYISGLYSQISRYEKIAEEAACRAGVVSEDLRRAEALICRLRAEIKVLQSERLKFISIVNDAKHHISIAGNPHKKWAVTLIKSKLQKATLL